MLFVCTKESIMQLSKQQIEYIENYLNQFTIDTEEYEQKIQYVYKYLDEFGYTDEKINEILYKIKHSL